MTQGIGGLQQTELDWGVWPEEPVVVESGKLQIVLGGIEDVAMARQAVLGAAKAAREPTVAYEGMVVDTVSRYELQPAPVASKSSSGHSVADSDETQAMSVSALGVSLAFASAMDSLCSDNSKGINAIAGSKSKGSSEKAAAAADTSANAPSTHAISAVDEQELEQWKRRLRDARHQQLHQRRKRRALVASLRKRLTRSRASRSSARHPMGIGGKAPASEAAEKGGTIKAQSAEATDHSASSSHRLPSTKPPRMPGGVASQAGFASKLMPGTAPDVTRAQPTHGEWSSGDEAGRRPDIARHTLPAAAMPSPLFQGLSASAGGPLGNSLGTRSPGVASSKSPPVLGGFAPGQRRTIPPSPLGQASGSAEDLSDLSLPSSAIGGGLGADVNGEDEEEDGESAGVGGHTRGASGGPPSGAQGGPVVMRRSASEGTASQRAVKSSARSASSASESDTRGGGTTSAGSDSGAGDTDNASGDEGRSLAPGSRQLGAQPTPMLTPFSPLQAASGIVPALPTGDEFLLDGGSASQGSGGGSSLNTTGSGEAASSRGAVGFSVSNTAENSAAAGTNLTVSQFLGSASQTEAQDASRGRSGGHGGGRGSHNGDGEQEQKQGSPVPHSPALQASVRGALVPQGQDGGVEERAWRLGQPPSLSLGGSQ